jgi:hypothetical protein
MLLPTVGKYTGLDDLLDDKRGLRKTLNQSQTYGWSWSLLLKSHLDGSLFLV